MTFFVDANVPIYASRDSRYGGPCLSILQAVVDGLDGRMSTAAVEEVWHVELRGRTAARPGLAERTLGIFSPLLSVTEEALREALGIEAPGLGANDRVHVATCRVNGIGTIVTADAAFDSIPGLKRVDPLDEEALSALLAGE